MRYLISIDQSTQGTKALLFNESGYLINRADLPHKQIINDQGWVSHDPEEIYQNTLQVIKNLVNNSQIAKEEVVGLGISNQRETSVIWDKESGKPLDNAIVWQCARATAICERENIKKNAERIREKTGINLSPYFPAAKIAWFLEHVSGAREKQKAHTICHSTVDAWLIYRLTEGKEYRTDYSNASRTQLFNIHQLRWDEEICELFGINPEDLPTVTDSDGLFGETTLEGFFPKPIPIHSVMGDSHAALFGQGCLQPGMLKTTYGTGSSIMMNIGEKPAKSTHGVVTSLAWCQQGKVNYVLEGNLNYTGAVITWLKEDMKLIDSPGETEELAKQANKNDHLYLIPAFTGLGAPYWDSNARAAVIGMDRTTTRAEFVRAGLECIAYQIADIVKAMEEDAGIVVKEVRVDGGPTRNTYLMQFQSDILGANVRVPDAEELSGIGAAYMAGLALNIWNQEVFSKLKRIDFKSTMNKKERERRISGWKSAITKVIGKN